VIEIGKNVKDIKVGDMVACAGAGKANHAEFVAIPENLVAKVLPGVDYKDASMTTIGAIAMQGVRQCNPLIGETIAVVGLGLIGQLTALILKANGVNVLGVETNSSRIELANKSGIKNVINPNAQNVLNEIKFLNSNLVDGVIITASGKDNKIINQALEITRKKGRIVCVGNIGLNISRSLWYEKEIDLKISYSYGPGRGDYAYEERGVDYPYEFVRFTEKRNMESFLGLLQNNSISLSNIINKEVNISDCLSVYQELKDRPE
jgi:threonine dehydrogenase-like Zn-dependent dehydrogenase